MSRLLSAYHRYRLRHSDRNDAAPQMRTVSHVVDGHRRTVRCVMQRCSQIGSVPSSNDRETTPPGLVAGPSQRMQEHKLQLHDEQTSRISVYPIGRLREKQEDHRRDNVETPRRRKCSGVSWSATSRKYPQGMQLESRLHTKILVFEPLEAPPRASRRPSHVGVQREEEKSEGSGGGQRKRVGPGVRVSLGRQARPCPRGMVAIR